MTVANNVVYVPNDTGQVQMYDTSGGLLGSFSSLFNAHDVLDFQGSLLVRGPTSISRHAYDGTFLGTFGPTNFVLGGQMDLDLAGNVLVADRDSNTIYRLDQATGNVLDSFNAPEAVGVHQLANGDILWADDGADVYVWQGQVLGSTLVGDNMGYFLESVVPEPSTCLALCVCLFGLASLRRRRR